MTQWFFFNATPPTENASARMRAWRALKASGAAVLRDGVYLMPERESCRNTLDSVATDILGAGGTVFVLRVEEPDGAAFVSLFDRREDYAVLLADISKAHAGLAAETAADTLKQARKLRKTFAGLAEIDFFPGEARRQAEAALQDLEQQAGWALSPDEPHAVAGTIPQLPLGLYLGRTWATRCRPWVDRLASAWLIRRFIAPDAHLLWPASPAAVVTEDLYVLRHYGEFWVALESARKLADHAAVLFDAAWNEGDRLTEAGRGDVAVAVATAKMAATRAGLDLTSRMFEVTGARSTTAALRLDRYWRNLRVHTLHDPADYKLRELGDWALNGRHPKPSFYS